ncbi:MAG: hypothetical protein ABJ327_09060 [Litoreibacter sp.]
MTQITFFPIGNADTSLVELNDGRRMLIDFADTKKPDDDAEKRCDLTKHIRDDLDGSDFDSYHIVAFTHLDDDHCHKSSEYFWLQHATKYQSDSRKKIDTLWVPATAITEEGVKDDGRIIRQEARYRLLEGKDIKVFSRPERLKDWLAEHGLTIEDRKDCFVDAGQIVGGLSLKDDKVEVFAHSPHAYRSDENEIEDRNGDSLVFQMRFEEGGNYTDVLFAADVPHEVISEIVEITKKKKNEERLHWNIYKLPHHCSYLSLSNDKGTNKTTPVEQVKWLCETQGEANGYIVSSSQPVPVKSSKEDEDVQPPHRQAANYYRQDVVNSDHMLVTMEQPKKSAPKPIVIEIGGRGAKLKHFGAPAAAMLVGGAAPRAGIDD